MKQISDEVFAQVRDALFNAGNALMFLHPKSDEMRDGCVDDCNKALAALDTARPVQVNAMLVEALQAAEKLEHEALVALSEATYELKVGNTYTTATDTYKANNDLIHRLDKILNLQYRDRKRTALTAAKQAQPERAPSVPVLTDEELTAFLRFDETTADDQSYDIEKPMMRRLAEIGLVFRKFGAYYQTTEYGVTVLSAAHGIKQGGQHD